MAPLQNSNKNHNKHGSLSPDEIAAQVSEARKRLTEAAAEREAAAKANNNARQATVEAAKARAADPSPTTDTPFSFNFTDAAEAHRVGNANISEEALVELGLTGDLVEGANFGALGVHVDEEGRHTGVLRGVGVSAGND